MYLLTGALALLIGIAVLIWMPDSPVHASILTKEERVIAVERVRDDQGGTENKKIKMSQVKEALLDVKIWLIVLLTLLSALFFDFAMHCLLICIYSEHTDWRAV